MAAAAPPAVRGFDEALSRDAVEEVLRDAPGAPPESAFVCVGDVIDTSTQEGFLRGHGTQVVDGRLVATVCGVVERVNKLVAVRPVHSRYSAEVGDIVVGRVTEIAGKKWRVDLRARQEAGLMLSAVNLPGGVQRRRTAEDELNMRALYTEGDLISAEVQSFYHDGTIALHTRSRKYGKLSRGQLVEVPSSLIKRQKQHFTTLQSAGAACVVDLHMRSVKEQHFTALQSAGVDMILGVNGLVWVSPHVERPSEQEGGLLAGRAGPSNEDMGGDDDSPPLPPPTDAELAAVARVAGALGALRALYLPVYPAAVEAVAGMAAREGVPPAAMTEPTFLGVVLEAELARRGADGGDGGY